MDYVVLLLAGTATALATSLGAIPVFLIGDRAERFRPAMWGFAGDPVGATLGGGLGGGIMLALGLALGV